MKIKNLKLKQGFTIIEVVLVLAIAGLIFLAIFIALPALQRAQRDQARKNDVGLVADAIKRWQGNNRGRSIASMGVSNLGGQSEDKIEGINNMRTLSAVPNGPLDSYLSIKEHVNDPSKGSLSANTEKVMIYSSETSEATTNHVHLIYDSKNPPVHLLRELVGYTCPSTSSSGSTTSNKTFITISKAAKNQVAILVFLENGGFYCQNL